MQKRKQRHSEILKDNFTENPLAISGPSNPWTTNEKLNSATMVRSNVWFDSLHRSIQRHHDSFINPMIASFPTVDEEDEEDIKVIKNIFLESLNFLSCKPFIQFFRLCKMRMNLNQTKSEEIHLIAQLGKYTSTPSQPLS